MSLQVRMLEGRVYYLPVIWNSLPVAKIVCYIIDTSFKYLL